MWPTVRFHAADWGGCASVDGKFEMQNRKLCAGTTETIPVGLDDVDNLFRSHIEADDKVLGEFRKVLFFLPDASISSDIDERLRRVADDIAQLFEFTDALLNVVAPMHRNMFVDRLRTPDLWRSTTKVLAGRATEGEGAVWAMGSAEVE